MFFVLCSEKAVFRPTDEAVFTTLGVNTHLFACEPAELETLMPLPEEIHWSPGDSKLHDMSAEEVANQLVVFDWELFSCVHEVEFVCYVFHGEQSRWRPLNLELILQRCSEVQHWVATEILQCQSLPKRVQLLRKFIKIAALCKQQQDLLSFLAVVLGLDNPAVSRLRLTWEGLPGKFRKQFQQFESIADPSRNHKSYRDLMASLRPPLIPFTPLLLKDLTFLHESCKTFHGELVNFEKMHKVAEMVRTIRRYRSSQLGSVFDKTRTQIVGRALLYAGPTDQDQALPADQDQSLPADQDQALPADQTPALLHPGLQIRLEVCSTLGCRSGLGSASPWTHRSGLGSAPPWTHRSGLGSAPPWAADQTPALLHPGLQIRLGVCFTLDPQIRLEVCSTLGCRSGLRSAPPWAADQAWGLLHPGLQIRLGVCSTLGCRSGLGSAPPWAAVRKLLYSWIVLPWTIKEIANHSSPSTGRPDFSLHPAQAGQARLQPAQPGQTSAFTQHSQARPDFRLQPAQAGQTSAFTQHRQARPGQTSPSTDRPGMHPWWLFVLTSQYRTTDVKSSVNTSKSSVNTSKCSVNTSKCSVNTSKSSVNTSKCSVNTSKSSVNTSGVRSLEAEPSPSHLQTKAYVRQLQVIDNQNLLFEMSCKLEPKDM
ncbi:hypothetical protein ACEWY4_027857 [Coilia grayii]|uniref:Ras-GEF domain-containing protein n=1 Tax=Coilia grayii TaxID=363190 RepID=A0ABD1ING4_9TELE